MEEHLLSERRKKKEKETHYISSSKIRIGVNREKNEQRGASDKRESKTHLELADIKKNAEWVVF